MRRRSIEGLEGTQRTKKTRKIYDLRFGRAFVDDAAEKMQEAGEFGGFEGLGLEEVGAECFCLLLILWKDRGGEHGDDEARAQ